MAETPSGVGNPDFGPGNGNMKLVEVIITHLLMSPEAKELLFLHSPEKKADCQLLGTLRVDLFLDCLSKLMGIKSVDLFVGGEH